MSARLAAMFLLAIHVAAASAPCPTPKLPAPGADPGALAGAHPCPGHAQEEAPPGVWFDALCPCGCETGPAPSNGSARIGPALLLAEVAPGDVWDRELSIGPLPALARFAPAPPDHVPLIA